MNEFVPCNRVHENIIIIIVDPSETDIPDRRPTYPIGDRHASPETHKKSHVTS